MFWLCEMKACLVCGKILSSRHFGIEFLRYKKFLFHLPSTETDAGFLYLNNLPTTPSGETVIVLITMYFFSTLNQNNAH